MNSSRTPGNIQVEDKRIRTRGLTILARILAASVIRKNARRQESSDNPGSHIDLFTKDEKDPETNEGREADQ